MTLSRQVMFATATMLAVLALGGCAKLNQAAMRLMVPLSPFQNSASEDGCGYEQVVVVTIPIAGKLYVGREPVNSLEELRGLVLLRLHQKPAYEKVVYIKAVSTVKSSKSAKVTKIVSSVGAVPKLLRP